jgi:hypothetical protein
MYGKCFDPTGAVSSAKAKEKQPILAIIQAQMRTTLLICEFMEPRIMTWPGHEQLLKRCA